MIAVMHAAGNDHDAVCLRALVIVFWRAGLRVSEALALSESDVDLHGAILVRRGNGGKRREAGPGSSSARWL
jgi:site-specific recombinase XerC